VHRSGKLDGLLNRNLLRIESPLSAPAHQPDSARIDAQQTLELVEAARQGEHQAFEELYRTRVASVARYVGALLSHRDAVEDVVAQTFLLAWRDLPRLREAGRFDAWLFRIARNQAITAGRRRTVTAPLEFVEASADEEVTRPERHLEQEASREEVQRALSRLPAEQRDVLVLRFVSELAHRDVAEQMGRTEQATRALQYRALLNLKSLLEKARGH
jgi:RNA polymerase sigma-70 factor (ECF subfamily)